MNDENFQQIYFLVVDTPTALGISRQICSASHGLTDEAAECFLDSTPIFQAGWKLKKKKAFPRLQTNRKDLVILPHTEPV